MVRWWWMKRQHRQGICELEKYMHAIHDPWLCKILFHMLLVHTDPLILQTSFQTLKPLDIKLLLSCWKYKLKSDLKKVESLMDSHILAQRPICWPFSQWFLLQQIHCAEQGLNAVLHLSKPRRFSGEIICHPNPCSSVYLWSERGVPNWHIDSCTEKRACL